MSRTNGENVGPTHATAPQYDAYMAKVAALIETYGWMAQEVFATEADPAMPPFVYTVGLHAKGHPEFIVAGIAPRQAHALLSVFAHRVLTGERFEPDRRSDVLQGDYDVLLRPCSRRQIDERLTMAQAIAGEDVEALQVVWPDAEGRLPGDGMDANQERSQDL